jgi:hypothetical protein
MSVEGIRRRRRERSQVNDDIDELLGAVNALSCMVVQLKRELGRMGAGGSPSRAEVLKRADDILDSLGLDPDGRPLPPMTEQMDCR